MIDLEKMAKEHEKLFPNATAESQFHKMEEEIGELYSAFENEDETKKELADVLIVCCGLHRFYPKTASALAVFFENRYSFKNISEEVNRKWQVNLKRKWVWNGKTYHHEGNDD